MEKQKEQENDGNVMHITWIKWNSAVERLKSVPIPQSVSGENTFIGSI